MYLKELTVRGFKSFASATTLTFEPGITAVVGPNGSGKSNVVDALAWVMGEQGAKNLRGVKMDDVIFAGTSKRPSLGRAQVSLTIDNSDGALPIEYSEVTISRTLFRSGGSEYSINGTSCRLLDIQELLSDSGLGREMHVIVGQGQLDRVLHASEEERRALIEEAAGVLKYRRRREKAYRKLLSTDAHLARLADLTSEVARALKPLERQAKVARRARDIQRDLKDAQYRLAADALCAARIKASETEKKTRDLQSRLQELDELASHFHVHRVQSQRENEENRLSLEEKTRELAAQSKILHELRGLLDVASTKARTLESHEEFDDRSQHMVRMQQLIREAAEEQSRLEEEAQEAQNLLQKLEETQSELSHKAQQAQSILTQSQREHAQSREEFLTAKSEVHIAEQKVHEARRTLERAQALEQDAIQSENESNRHFEQVREELERITQEDKLSEQLAQATEQRREAEQKHRDAQEEFYARRSEADALHARSCALREALDAATAREERGGSSSHTSENSSTCEAFGRLSDGLVVRQEWALALGALLDSNARADVLPREDGKILAQEEVRPFPLIFSDPIASVSESVAHQEKPKVLYATDVVEKSTYTEALEALLAQVALCSSIDEAMRLLLKESSLRMCATSDGAIVQRSGISFPLAQRKHQSEHSNVVELSSRLASLEKSTTEAARKRDQAQTKAEKAEADFQASRDTAESLKNTLGEYKTRQAVAQAAYVAGLKTVRQARERSEHLEKEVESASEKLRMGLVAAKEQEQKLASFEELERQRQEGSSSLELLAEAASQARRESEEASSQYTQAAIAERGAREKARSLSSYHSSLERDLETAQTEAREGRRRQRRHRILMARAERVAELASLACERGSKRENDAQNEVAKARDRHVRSSQRVQKIINEERSRREEYAQLEKEAIAQRTHLEHESARVRELERSVKEELGFEPEKLILEYGPEVPLEDGRDFSRKEQEERFAAASRDMTALGKVNPLALEEFATLEQRHSFLSGQLGDLRGSRADLMKIIQDVDETIERVLRSAYEDTAREFVSVFSRLFPGGEGSLELSEPEDILSSGLQINARPAGKKVKRLSLLSGGERSLTAIALLVAIFKARPSPFYVLDEVEAALDDANLGRLLTVLCELQSSSQLVIVTHQKRTMEIADALYGVSMRGDGVSLVLSQRLDPYRPGQEKESSVSTKA